MKKIICTLLVSLVFISSFISCKHATLPQDITCETILNKALSVGMNDDFDSEYLKSQDNFNSVLLSLWADGMFAESKDIEYISDYAIRIGSAGNTFEIAILKARDMESVDKVYSIIERRKQTISGGDNSLYDPNFSIRFDNMIIKSEGLFVIMLMTEDNESRLNKIDELKS